jgi:hypothetical protein
MKQSYLNDTWVYSNYNGLCPNASASYCTTMRGGLYDGNASSTVHLATSVYDAQGDPSDGQPTLITHIWNNSWVDDTLYLGNATLPHFPLGIPGFDFGGALDTQNNIGLGVNSTLLTTLRDAGLIASRSFSWWWGQTGATTNAQMDGSIVFGGYDAAKVIGSPMTQSLLPPSIDCPSGMVVQITNILLGFPNGTTTSITQPAALTACLQPDLTVLMTLPFEPFYDTFESQTQTTNLGRGGGPGIDFWGVLYDPTKV